MTNAQHGRLRVAFFVDLRTLRLPVLAEDSGGNLARLANAARVAVVEDVQNLVGRSQRLVLQRGVARQSLRQLLQCVEVPTEAPGFLVGNDDVGGSDLGALSTARREEGGGSMHTEKKRFISGGWMMSPSQGTPNMPLQLISMTNSCLPDLTMSCGMMYSTLRSPPPPPVIPEEARVGREMREDAV